MNNYRINTSAPDLMCICIDETADSGDRGRLYHKYIAEPVVFLNLGDLLTEMEKVFDLTGYPERSTQRRTFRDEAKPDPGGGPRGTRRPGEARKEAVQVTDTDTILKQSGELATFVVHVKFRQYSTWQGEIVWAEKNRKCNFRSALELLKLIDGALDEEGGPPEGEESLLT